MVDLAPLSAVQMEKNWHVAGITYHVTKNRLIDGAEALRRGDLSKAAQQALAKEFAHTIALAERLYAPVLAQSESDDAE